MKTTQELAVRLNQANEFFVEMEGEYNRLRNRKSNNEDGDSEKSICLVSLSSADQDLSKLEILNGNLAYLEEEIEFTCQSLTIYCPNIKPMTDKWILHPPFGRWPGTSGSPRVLVIGGIRSIVA